MNRWVIGFSTGCFYKRKIFDCLPLIKDRGFTYIEISASCPHFNYDDLGEVLELKECLETMGLFPYSFHSPFGEEIDISSPGKAFRNGSMNLMFRAAEAARSLRSLYFIVHPGSDVPEGVSRSEKTLRKSYALENIRHLNRYCHSGGVTLLLENTLPYNLFGNTEETACVFSCLKSERIGLCFDTGHSHISQDKHSFLKRFAEDIRHVHASDNFGKEDLHLPPGQGDIEWKDLFFRLHAVNYPGVIMIETIAGDRSDARAIDEASEARSFLRRFEDRGTRC